MSKDTSVWQRLVVLFNYFVLVVKNFSPIFKAVVATIDRMIVAIVLNEEVEAHYRELDAIMETGGFVEDLDEIMALELVDNRMDKADY